MKKRRREEKRKTYDSHDSISLLVPSGLIFNDDSVEGWRREKRLDVV